MLSKLDIELYKILDSEIPKDLSFGCWVKQSWIICKYLSEITTNWGWAKMMESVTEYCLYDNIENEYIQCRNIDKILGHYPTTNEVLRYVNHKKVLKFSLFEDYIYIMCRSAIDYRLYLTPIQKQTDEEKRELIDFLKLIK